MRLLSESVPNPSRETLEHQLQELEVEIERFQDNPMLFWRFTRISISILFVLKRMGETGLEARYFIG